MVIIYIVWSSLVWVVVFWWFNLEIILGRYLALKKKFNTELNSSSLNTRVVLEMYFHLLYVNFHHSRTEQRNNTTAAVYGAGNAYPSGAPDLTPGF